MHLLKTRAAKVSLSESLNASLDCHAGRIVRNLHIDPRSGLIGRYGPADRRNALVSLAMSQIADRWLEYFAIFLGGRSGAYA
jgi:hypothetical protein